MSSDQLLCAVLTCLPFTVPCMTVHMENSENQNCLLKNNRSFVFALICFSLIKIKIIFKINKYLHCFLKPHEYSSEHLKLEQTAAKRNNGLFRNTWFCFQPFHRMSCHMMSQDKAEVQGTGFAALSNQSHISVTLSNTRHLQNWPPCIVRHQAETLSLVLKDWDTGEIWPWSPHKSIIKVSHFPSSAPIQSLTNHPLIPHPPPTPLSSILFQKTWNHQQDLESPSLDVNATSCQKCFLLDFPDVPVLQTSMMPSNTHLPNWRTDTCSTDFNNAIWYTSFFKCLNRLDNYSISVLLYAVEFAKSRR